MDWISVDDRLPKTFTLILFFGKEYDDVTRHGQYGGGRWYDCDWSDDPIESEITHWMPLPKPPIAAPDQ